MLGQFGIHKLCGCTLQNNQLVMTSAVVILVEVLQLNPSEVVVPVPADRAPKAGAGGSVFDVLNEKRCWNIGVLGVVLVLVAGNSNAHLQPCGIPDELEVGFFVIAMQQETLQLSVGSSRHFLSTNSPNDFPCTDRVEREPFCAKPKPKAFEFVMDRLLVGKPRPREARDKAQLLGRPRPEGVVAFSWVTRGESYFVGRRLSLLQKIDRHVAPPKLATEHAHSRQVCRQ